MHGWRGEGLRGDLHDLKATLLSESAKDNVPSGRGIGMKS